MAKGKNCSLCNASGSPLHRVGDEGPFCGDCFAKLPDLYAATIQQLKHDKAITENRMQEVRAKSIRLETELSDARNMFLAEAAEICGDYADDVAGKRSMMKPGDPGFTALTGGVHAAKDIKKAIERAATGEIVDRNAVVTDMPATTTPRPPSDGPMQSECASMTICLDRAKSHAAAEFEATVEGGDSREHEIRKTEALACRAAISASREIAR